MPQKYAQLGDTEQGDVDITVAEFEVLESKPGRRCQRCSRISRCCKWSMGVLLLLAIIVMAIIVLSLKGYIELPGSNNTNTTNNALLQESAEFVLGAMDRSVDPCSDFYRYACGAWLASYQLPKDEPSHTRSFGMLRDANIAMLGQLMQSAELEYVSPAYRLCTDLARLDARGLAPLEPYRQRIEAAGDLPALATLLGQLSTEGMRLGAFFSLVVEADDMNSSRYLVTLWQSGLTLPDPSYYQRDTTSLAAWIEQAFVASPDGALNSTALDELVELERQLAAAMYSPSQNRDVSQVYNNVSVAEARTTLGQLAGFLDAFSLQSTEVLNLAQLNYFRALGLVLSRRSLGTLKNYVKLRLYQSTFHLLGQPQRAVSHAYREMIYGTSSSPSRDEYCSSAISASMPMLVGKYFVEQNSIDTAEAAEILEHLEQSYSVSFGQVDWMDAATASAAQQKLEAITNKVGWPAEWPDFAAFYGNVQFSDYFEFQVSLARTAAAEALLQRNETVDREVWGMSPSAVNAYYSPSFNEIVFPLGILQFPFYRPGNLKAMNYGGIGTVQGHELGHAFDDGGSKYDAQGYLRDWWTPASRSLFEAEVQCVEQQFSRFEVAPGVSVQGSLVVGEALGDIGGVANAYQAYQAWRLSSDDANSEDELAAEYFNMTADELFFVSFGQLWCSVASPDYLVMLTSTDPHPPGAFRVQGTLSDMPQFAEVFGCAAGSTYNPAAACVVW